MNGTMYYVETMFYPHDDRSELLTAHAERGVFGDLESARKFAREWSNDDDTHQAIIWQAVEVVEHQEKEVE